jgi:phage protein D
VAAYVPGRTLARDVETHEETFNSQTLPSGVQADRLIADAVRWVLARTGEVDTSLHEYAASVAAVRAAMYVERGYPATKSEEQSLARARDLERQADAMLDSLVFANRTPDTQGNALVPLWSMPPPVAWGDENFI